MSLNFELSCKCGKVAGKIESAPTQMLNHAVCYCNDCQAYAHALGQSEEMLDDNGGSRILQVARSRSEIIRGYEHVRCLRLSPKGLHRFYASK